MSTLALVLQLETRCLLWSSTCLLGAKASSDNGSNVYPDHPRKDLGMTILPCDVMSGLFSLCCHVRSILLCVSMSGLFWPVSVCWPVRQLFCFDTTSRKTLRRASARCIAPPPLQHHNCAASMVCAYFALRRTLPPLCIYIRMCTYSELQERQASITSRAA